MTDYFAEYKEALRKADEKRFGSLSWLKAEADVRKVFFAGLKANEPHIVCDAVEALLRMVEDDEPAATIIKFYEQIKESNPAAAKEALELLEVEEDVVNFFRK